MIKYSIIILLMPFILFCFMVLRGYRMYFRSGGKRKIIEQINYLESSEGYITLEHISPLILFVTMALEDRVFFLHKGINIHTIKKALAINIKNRRLVMGGSTITQQLGKNLLFNFHKSFTRKFAELFAVWFLEKNYSKEKILEIYLNCIQYGENKIGIHAACQYYFGKLPHEVKLGQAITLALILPSPNNYSPVINPDRYYKVRANTIDFLNKLNYIDDMACSRLRESDYLAEDLFHEEIERFYKEIFKNAIRAAKANKAVLRVEIDSLVAQKILGGQITSKGLVAHAYDCCRNLKTSYVWGGMMPYMI